VLKKWRQWLTGASPSTLPDELDWLSGHPGFGLRPAQVDIETSRQPPPEWPDYRRLEPPPDFEGYRRLLHRVFDSARQRLATEAAREPVLVETYMRWRPGAEASNMRLFYPAFERLSTLMGMIYGFAPARLGYSADMRGSFGQYDHKGVVLFAERLLDEPVGEVFDTIVHEQIHRLQHRMTEALTPRGRRRMTDDEARLALYWEREEPLAQAFYRQPPEDADMPAYRRLGKEYHAFDTGEYVSAQLLRAFWRLSRRA
jgi:hypothetical protein